MIKLRDFIINAAILIELVVILVIEYKAAKEKRTLENENLNHKIMAVLIRHGGKMSCLGISKYLEISHEIIAARIGEMEKKKLICRKGDDEFVYIMKSSATVRRSASGEYKIET